MAEVWEGLVSWGFPVAGAVTLALVLARIAAFLIVRAARFIVRKLEERDAAHA